MYKCSQVKNLEKDCPSSPTGVEPMTFQNTSWNALTTELLYKGLVVSKVIYWVLMCDTWT